MAITQISQIQVRRGLQQDLPQLAAGELAWSTDLQRLYIGNGVLSAPDYAPVEGRTEILTQNSIVNFTNTLVANVIILQGNIETLNSQVAALQQGVLTSSNVTLGTNSSGTITTFTGNNNVITYSLGQGNTQRTGTIKAAFNKTTSTVIYEEDYVETGATDIVFTMSANSTTASLNYTTTSATYLQYRKQTQ